MMSKERELLQEVLNKSYFIKDTVMEGIFNRIEELLAQPETEQEPVAWMYDWKTPTEEIQNVFRSKNHLTTDLRCVSNEVENVRPLYLAPPTLEPLSNLAIKEDGRNAKDMSFYNGVRWAEQQHDIGVDDANR
jgi:hypothetical protein